MPAATETPAANKKEREELLWQALKEHIMQERQKKREGRLIWSDQYDRFFCYCFPYFVLSIEQEAEKEEERLRKEREERDRQDAMTLGETKEQIQLLTNRLEELKDEKQQLFLRLKKVLNEDEIRKKQQQQKDRFEFFMFFLYEWLSVTDKYLSKRI